MHITVHVLTHKHAQAIMAAWDRDSWFNDFIFLPTTMRRALSRLLGRYRRALTTAWCNIETGEVFIDGGAFGLQPATTWTDITSMQHPKEAAKRVLNDMRVEWSERLALTVMHEIGHIYWRCGHTFIPQYLMFPSWFGRGWKIGRP